MLHYPHVLFRWFSICSTRASLKNLKTQLSWSETLVLQFKIWYHVWFLLIVIITALWGYQVRMWFVISCKINLILLRCISHSGFFVLCEFFWFCSLDWFLLNKTQVREFSNFT
jgi:hypothetical protein